MSTDQRLYLGVVAAVGGCTSEYSVRSHHVMSQYVRSQHVMSQFVMCQHVRGCSSEYSVRSHACGTLGLEQVMMATDGFHGRDGYADQLHTGGCPCDHGRLGAGQEDGQVPPAPGPDRGLPGRSAIIWILNHPKL